MSGPIKTDVAAAVAAAVATTTKEKKSTKKGKNERQKTKHSTSPVVIPFRDRAKDPNLKPPLTTARAPSGSKSPRNRAGKGAGSMGHFPTILHLLLARSKSSEYEDVVAWQPHGRSFVVQDRALFVSRIMPKYFRQTQFSSFQRQLNLYGFKSISSKQNADCGAYYHEFFLRTRPDLCERMQRPRDTGSDNNDIPRPPKGLVEEPNFSNMSSMPPATEAEMVGADNFSLTTLNDAKAKAASMNKTKIPSLLGNSNPRWGAVPGATNITKNASTIDLAAVAAAASSMPLLIPPSIPGGRNVAWGTTNNNMAGTTFWLQQQQQPHGQHMLQGTFGSSSVGPPTAVSMTPAAMAASTSTAPHPPTATSTSGDRMGFNLVANTNRNNQEPVMGKSKNTKDDMLDLMEMMEPTPIAPSVFSKRSKKPQQRSLVSASNDEISVAKPLPPAAPSLTGSLSSVPDSRLLTLLYRQQQEQQLSCNNSSCSSRLKRELSGPSTCGVGLPQDMRIHLAKQRKHEMLRHHQQQPQEEAEPMPFYADDANGMAGFLSDVDLESDDHLDPNFDDTIIPGHVVCSSSHLFKTQAQATTNPLSLVTTTPMDTLTVSPRPSTTTTTQQQQQQTHQQQPLTVLGQEHNQNPHQPLPMSVPNHDRDPHQQYQQQRPI